MSEETTRLDGCVELDLASSELRVNLGELVRTLASSWGEDKLRQFVQIVCKQEMYDQERFRAFVDYLTDETTYRDGSWVSWDVEDRLYFLTKVEHVLASGVKWNLLNQVHRLSNNVESHQHIYWAMYHEEDEELRRTFHEWLRRKGFTSNYTDKFPTQQAVVSWIEDMFKAIANGIAELPSFQPPHTEEAGNA